MRLVRLWAAAAPALGAGPCPAQPAAAAAAAALRLFSSSSTQQAAWPQQQQQQRELSSSSAAASTSSPEHPDPSSSSVPVHRITSETIYEDESQAGNKVKYVSRERRLVPRPPFYRPPIFFPEIRLQMMKLTDEQRNQIRDTGWTREVAFKTTPNVTKLEIKGVLEAMYNMQVEKVHTINYLGRKHLTYSSHKQPKRLHWRADDWKKAYVMFRPPEGLVLAEVAEPKERVPMLQQLLVAKGLVKPPEEQKQGQVEGSEELGGAEASGRASLPA